ncbi:MAG TPA: hypothetical protein VNV82_12660 [Bryobacteraceae bacterium]|nr:hypothetical protein [Bryobacteraceae bacterium]
MKNPFPVLIVAVDVVPSPQLIVLEKSDTDWLGLVSVKVATVLLNAIPSTTFRFDALVIMIAAFSPLLPNADAQANRRVPERLFIAVSEVS